MFTGKRKWLLYGLGLLFLAGLMAFVLTRSSERPLLTDRSKSATPPQPKLVDQGPLQTANSLASAASTAEEQQIAARAVQIADQEVDLAFATALRQAQDNPPAQQGSIKQLRDRVHSLESHLKPLEANVDRLKKLAASGTNDDAQRPTGDGAGKGDSAAGQSRGRQAGFAARGRRPARRDPARTGRT